MDSFEKRLIDIREKLQDLQNESIRREERKLQLTNKIKNEFKCTSLKQALSLLDEMKEGASLLNNEIEKLTTELEESLSKFKDSNEF